jgi:6-phosphogluconate dehydrogenase
MQLAMIGLGRMGGNMARRLIRAGHEVIGFNRSPEPVRALVKDGGKGASSIDELIAQLKPPRALWVMVPAGDATERMVMQLAAKLAPGDTVIDGGNSYFKDDVRRGKVLAEKKLHYVDVGTSGGIWGIDRGYCLMIGGPKEAVSRLEPIFKALAPGRGDVGRTPGRDRAAASTAEDGWLHCGPTGAGHFVKMVHNGIEYGLMQAYAEGFDILRNAGSAEVAPDHRFSFNLTDVAEVWRRGSVVGSWLLDLAATALLEEPDLGSYVGNVADSGEGRWTIQAAIEEAVPVDVLSAALYTRFRSREEHTFAEKILSAMRKKFGGHVEKK